MPRELLLSRWVGHRLSNVSLVVLFAVALVACTPDRDRAERGAPGVPTASTAPAKASKLGELCGSPAVARFVVTPSVPEAGSPSAVSAAALWRLSGERAVVVGTEKAPVRHIAVGQDPRTPRLVLTVVRSVRGWVIESTTACLEEAPTGPVTCQDELYFDGRVYVQASQPRGTGPGVGAGLGLATLDLCRARGPGAVRSRGPVAPVRVYRANEQPHSEAIVVSNRGSAPRLFVADGSRLVRAVSKSPAAGICGWSDESTVTILINPDTPSPRCSLVFPDQNLKIVNSTNKFGQPGESITVMLPGGLQRLIPVGGSFLVDRPFGAYLAPGVHRITISPQASGGEIWLRKSTRIAVESHCGVQSVWLGDTLWLANPPLGDHNPPPGWGENTTPGYFTVVVEGGAVFRGDAGQVAMFRKAPPDADDPAAGCE